jgi:hypothetical protein
VPFAFAAPPVAFDATGRRVAARFTTDGRSSVTVHAAHRGRGVRYPVAVDPLWGPVAAAIILAAAEGCAIGAAEGLLRSIIRNHVAPGSTRWKQMLWQAADDCVWGALFGVAGRFLPGWVKQRIATAIRGRIYDLLRRRVT